MGAETTLKLVKAETRQTQFDIIVAPGFVLTELAALVDVLRIANRVCPHPPFAYTYRSLRGGLIESSSGAVVATERVPAQPRADYLFVIGNSDPDQPELSLGRVVKDYTFRGAQVFLLAEAASRYINERGTADLATHWENAAFLRERGARFDATFSLATEQGPVVTCAGMGATVDVVLSVIGRHVSGPAKMTVADIMLHEHIRDFATMQPFSGIKTTSTGDEALDQCIKMMQANIEDPLPIGEIVAALGLSNRSLERKFRTYMGTTPNNFYREMRLAKANSLLLNTAMSVREIGLACGFPNGFSAVYKSFYGVTPFVLRRQKRAAVQR
ncbi:helix-turn-helix domain-containing protein [Ruegeria pomeroyi]|uniref:Helix-turn-helix domain-containing protein n=2 Tax=Ruegeria TaxID=97050 RepID=A0A9Q3WM84_9RHOB|nr:MULTISPECIES: helix-turn-helix domain-containing protein [Ruegeria]MCE8512559.1 helix-turn-helix domain-containing protein [Ruegeria pomeroyi]MCE8517404.1 helix-turn-helix domain-containing protein [Ruegeria pomeroyi]MCE8525340.1 helix-turn-helix domain-containing protein [Ruegeria pomeroyi]MCE8538524.1 helix-turn-helix domain-containing protein [Ruegeria pomeroyi]MCE8553289.1 helix-turn-helix domain-containing protein [Ruegeria pomeroyi]